MNRKLYTILVLSGFAGGILIYGWMSRMLYKMMPAGSSFASLPLMAVMGGYLIAGIISGILIFAAFIRRQPTGLKVAVCILFPLTFFAVCIIGMYGTIPYFIYNLVQMARQKNNIRRNGTDADRMNLYNRNKLSKILWVYNVRLYGGQILCLFILPVVVTVHTLVRGEVLWLRYLISMMFCILIGTTVIKYCRLYLASIIHVKCDIILYYNFCRVYAEKPGRRTRDEWHLPMIQALILLGDYEHTKAELEKVNARKHKLNKKRSLFLIYLECLYYGETGKTEEFAEKKRELSGWPKDNKARFRTSKIYKHYKQSIEFLTMHLEENWESLREVVSQRQNPSRLQQTIDAYWLGCAEKAAGRMDTAGKHFEFCLANGGNSKYVVMARTQLAELRARHSQLIQTVNSNLPVKNNLIDRNKLLLRAALFVAVILYLLISPARGSYFNAEDAYNNKYLLADKYSSLDILYSEEWDEYRVEVIMDGNSFIVLIYIKEVDNSKISYSVCSKVRSGSFFDVYDGGNLTEEALKLIRENTVRTYLPMVSSDMPKTRKSSAPLSGVASSSDAANIYIKGKSADKIVPIEVDGHTNYIWLYYEIDYTDEATYESIEYKN